MTERRRSRPTCRSHRIPVAGVAAAIGLITRSAPSATRRGRRGRRQGAPRPDARPPSVRHPDPLPRAPGRLRVDGRADHGAELRTGFGGSAGTRIGGDRTGRLRCAADARDAARWHSSPRRRPRARSAWSARSRPSSCSSSTPITSLAIVIGKLFSALIYVWLLIAASIPLTAVVFVFGGVAPDDVLHGYLVLIVTALGFGAFGLLASSLVKRTQAAIGDHVFGVLFLSIGSLFHPVSGRHGLVGRGRGDRADQGIAAGKRSSILNPFIAQADVPADTLWARPSAPGARSDPETSYSTATTV